MTSSFKTTLNRYPSLVLLTDQSLKYDIINSIMLFMHQIIVRARVEDAQLGVESYQTSINFIAPQMQIQGIPKMKPFTFNNKPFGVVFTKNNVNKLMRYDELHKFGDQTLKFIIIQLDQKLKEHNSGINVG